VAILVDQPRWPAHGTVWAHLVSDRSLEELHSFARANGVPPRSFDLDHYDVPAERLDSLLAAGAELVPGRELVARLRASGLRVRGSERHEERHRRLTADLARRWAALAARTLADDEDPGPRPADVRVSAEWVETGAELLRRWDEPHRRYHDLTHLDDVLHHLDVLRADGEAVPVTVELAAWFHDAVYDLVPGADEQRSAELARERLTGLGAGLATVAEVERLVLLTASHAPAPGDASGAVLCDADLAILASSPRRYVRYAGAVRAEYASVPDEAFRRGRVAVLTGLLAHERLFTTVSGRARWETRARENLRCELGRLDRPQD
jgi:predicted metal-dependent HD superfamily phosphohydrolase